MFTESIGVSFDKKYVKKNIHSYFPFFFLDEKETKNQEKMKFSTFFHCSLLSFITTES